MKILCVIDSATCMVLSLNNNDATVLNKKEKNLVMRTVNFPGRYTNTLTGYTAATGTTNTQETDRPLVYEKLIAGFKTIKKLSQPAAGEILFIRYSSEGKQTSTVYRNGKMKYCIANTANQLPGSTMEKLKAGYPSYAVFYSREIKTDDKIIYQVIIHNSQEYRVINIEHGGMEEKQRVKKVFH